MENRLELISPIQKGIWVKQNLYSDSAMFNVGGYVELSGDVDVPFLISAFDLFLENADAIKLAADFACNPTGKNKMHLCEFMDFSGKNDPVNASLKWIHNDIKQKMNLSSSLINVRIIKNSSHHYYLYFKAHHLIIDGFGFEFMINSVSVIYSKLKNNMDLLLSDFGYHFADFIKEYNEYEGSAAYDADRTFWLEKLSGIKWNKGFGSVVNSKQEGCMTALRKEIVLKRHVFDEIDKFCKENNSTPFHYIISLILILNDRSNNDTFVMGLPVFNRRNKAHKNTFGLFMNILPFCVAIGDNHTLRNVMQHVKEETRACYRHQAFPLTGLHDELGLSRNYFNVLFSYQKIEYENNLYGSKSKSVYLNCGEQEEDIIFHLVEYSTEEDLIVAFDYKTDAFSEEAIQQIINNFSLLLDHLLRYPDVRIKEISLLSREDVEAINRFNNTDVVLPAGKNFIDFFEEQVKNTPENSAVIFNDVTLTYRELNESANRLAHFLRTNFKINADDIIGLKLERSHWMLISILGILKSGAAYIPLDIMNPASRVSYILENAGCKLLLDEEKLNEFRDVSANYSAENPEKNCSSANLAYVIYTSGSTGNPKGSMIEHAGMLNHLLAMKSEFQLDCNTRIAQNASYTFDISVWQLLNALIVGGTTVIFDEETILQPENFVNKVISLDVTVLQVVPSYLKSILHLAETKDDRGLSKLQYLSVTGEAVTHQLLKSWFAVYPTVKVVNAYGPAEASDDVTLHIMDKVPEERTSSVGKPIQNVKIYIVDKTGKQCPVGLEGEICVSGIAVGRGYINEPEKTRAVFITDPFTEEKDVRMYRTGDMGRWLSDGTIEFIGRKDEQVKIRGYRIELGEIEQALLVHPAIKDTIIIAKVGTDKEKYIAAYLVSDGELNIQELRNYLSNCLPAYMIPSFFIPLAEMPLNRNGKIDRKKLPDPEVAALRTYMEYVPPQNETEKKLVKIWEEVLNIENIGIRNNFFELGGHSLKAIKVLSRIRDEFDVTMAMSSFFREPDVESTAKCLDALLCLQPDDKVINEGLIF